jgi:hypothetical protein
MKTEIIEVNITDILVEIENGSKRIRSESGIAMKRRVFSIM